MFEKTRLGISQALTMILAVMSTMWTDPKQAKQIATAYTIDAKQRNAFGGVLIGGVMLVVVGGVFLIIGIFLTATLETAIPAVNDPAYNISVTKIKGNINTAFEILGLALMVMGVGVIVASLLGFMGGGKK